MMDRMHSALMTLQTDRSGATAIEYGLIAAIISMSILIWAISIGSSVTGFFNTIASGM